MYNQPNDQGFYGEYGGQFVAETLMSAIKELNKAYEDGSSIVVSQKWFGEDRLLTK